MNRWQLLLTALVLSSLCACAAQQGPLSVAPEGKEAAAPVAELSCAKIDNGALLTVSYLSEAIYRSGAALPKAEGLVCLEELAEWLKKTPQSRWQVTVAGEEGRGFDPLALAGKRQELLQRFFVRKGLEMHGWQWQTVAGQAVQLKLLQIKTAP